MCNNPNAMENMYHFFWECNTAQKLWRFVKQMCEKLDDKQSQIWTYESVIFNKITDQ